VRVSRAQVERGLLSCILDKANSRRDRFRRRTLRRCIALACCRRRGVRTGRRAA